MSLGAVWTFFQLGCLVTLIVLISSFSLTLRNFIRDIWEKIRVAIGFGLLTAEVTAVHIPTINLKKADIVFDLLITNPNPLSIPLAGISYLIESDGRKLVSGSISESGRVDARSSKIVNITATLIYDEIRSTYNDIKPGRVIPYRIKLDVDIVDIPVIGRFALPLEKKGEIPVPAKPDAELTKIKCDKLSWEEIAVTLHLLLKHNNEFDLSLKWLEFELWVCEARIAGVTLAKSDKIEKNGAAMVEIPVTFSPKDFGHAIWNAFKGKSIGYLLKGNIVIDTEFGNMELPIIKEGGITSMEKHEHGDDNNEGQKQHKVIHEPKTEVGSHVPPLEDPQPFLLPISMPEIFPTTVTPFITPTPYEKILPHSD